jgi:hypothetical protein
VSLNQFQASLSGANIAVNGEDQAVDGAAILLGEMTDGRIDPEQAWFWTREWQQREREADEDLAAGRVTRYESDEQFLAALDERTKPLDADA